MSGYNMADADCHYGDHHWNGGVCSNCGKRFRCQCGAFLSVDRIDQHIGTEDKPGPCRISQKWAAGTKEPLQDDLKG